MTSNTTTTNNNNNHNMDSATQIEEQEEGDENNNNTVNLLDLAASALASTVAASRPIRERSAIYAEGDDKNARIKLDGTVVTDADGEAQGIIVRALTQISNQIRIVGEESQQEMERHESSTKNQQIEVVRHNERIFQCCKQEIYERYHHNDAGHNSQEAVLPLAQTIVNKDENDTTSTTIEGGKEITDGPATSTDASPSSSTSPILVDPARVSVYVDPLDGTKCYANHQYESVTILIAIILDNIPWFGVICKPFGSQGLPSILDTGCAAIYGGCLLGGVYVAGGKQLKRKRASIPPLSEPHQLLNEDSDATFPSDENEDSDVEKGPPKAILPLPAKSVGVVQDFVDDLANRGMLHPQSIHASGAGEKSMRLVLGIENEGLWFWPKKGTSRWDVAASDALLRVMGGRMTDKDGNDLDYSKARTESENTNGIIACTDIRMHKEIMKLFEEGKWDDKLLS